MEQFKESQLAHEYLDGLKGLEIGGSWWNQFGLNTLNVDIQPNGYHDKFEDIGVMPVDILANGDNIPVPDKSWDFIISSHVIEHFYDPIKALREWERIAKKYIFIICPDKNKTFDKEKPLTTLEEILNREPKEVYKDAHWNIWTPESFMELMEYLQFNVVKLQTPDDKVGNGFSVVIDVRK